MEQSIREVMTPDPLVLSATAPIIDAAQAMRDLGIGDVMVLDAEQNLFGIVTDRDIALRAVAEGLDPATAQLAEICSRAVVTLSATDTVADAVRTMSEQALRRLPVLEGDIPVGIVSLGDLALERDPESALATISLAPANN
jgi:signal-transduction protein with cAMP-binding, CBS, and nucleotidyltransferase domain